MLASCKRHAPAAAGNAEFPNDVPILKTKEGDVWQYRVISELHRADGTVDRREGRRSRRTLGKVEPLPGKGLVDVFEVSEDGRRMELEFVDIEPTVVRMRGSQSLRDPNAKPVVLEKGVPFVSAGLRGGEDLPEMRMAAPNAAPGAVQVTRKLRVIGRERIEVPAGNFDAIKLLMTGQEGSEKQGLIELRRTIWFAPGDGIVREDKERIFQGKLLVREEHLLVSLTRVP